MRKTHAPLRRAGVALAAALTLALAACSSDGSGPSGSGADTDLDQVSSDLQPFLEEPTEITQTEQLSAAPDAKSVAFIVCADPTCTVLDGYLEDAVTALGWDYSSVNAPATDYGSAVQQAIDLGVDYIAGTGSDIAAFEPQMAAMEKAGINYFSCYSTDVPEGEANNLYANCADASSSEVYTKALVDWMVDDASGEANALVVNLPAFPILTAQAEDAAEYIGSSCGECTVHELELTPDDLAAGAGPNAIVSYLQSNPDVNYIYLVFGGFETGLGAALASAGLADSVKVVGSQPQQPQLQSIIKGETDAWSALPQEYAMWSLADQMARVATGDWTSENERENAVLPFYIVDSAEDAEELVDLPNGWAGPDGLQDQFRAVWGVE